MIPIDLIDLVTQYLTDVKFMEIIDKNKYIISHLSIPVQTYIHLIVYNENPIFFLPKKIIYNDIKCLKNKIRYSYSQFYLMFLIKTLDFDLLSKNNIHLLTDLLAKITNFKMIDEYIDKYVCQAQTKNTFVNKICNNNNIKLLKSIKEKYILDKKYIVTLLLNKLVILSECTCFDKIFKMFEVTVQDKPYISENILTFNQKSLFCNTNFFRSVLINFGYTINDILDTRCHILIITCYYGCVENVKFLCKHYKLKKDQIKNHNNCLLRFTCLGKNTKEVLQYLHNKYKFTQMDIFAGYNSCEFCYENYPHVSSTDNSIKEREIFEFISKFWHNRVSKDKNKNEEILKNVYGNYFSDEYIYDQYFLLPCAFECVCLNGDIFFIKYFFEEKLIKKRSAQTVLKIYMKYYKLTSFKFLDGEIHIAI